ncbi:MAG: oxidoreductase, partial [Porticoccaceae bacterium]|nr:oxidoreductase [Porticoccaceae bacterium]
MNTERDFFVVAREPGAENPSLPTWGSRIENPAMLSDEAPLIVARKDLPQVPGAFQLLNVLSSEECQRLIELSAALGYLPDAAVSLPREVR